MWRSFFLAVGIYCCLLGAQCLAVEKAVLTSRNPPTPGPLGFMRSAFRTRNQEFVPPDWAPWTLLSVGAVTLLYSFTIPNRAKKE